MSVRRDIEVVAAIICHDNRVFATQRGYGEWKGWWEFPGGKIEKEESPQQALRREIKEELNADIAVGELLTTVEYDYPKFHLTMHCFLCKVTSGKLTLLEHEAAKWLTSDELHNLKWLPADIEVAQLVKKYISHHADLYMPDPEPTAARTHMRRALRF